MDSSRWRIGAALLCAAVVGACQKTEPPSTAGDTCAACPSDIMGDWPIQDLVLVTDNQTRKKPAYLFRIHMDVLVDTISDSLETSVDNRDGDGILKEIIADLVDKGEPSGWATLKAALGCEDLTEQNSTCQGKPGSTDADLFLLRDFSDDPKRRSNPMNILRVQMDYKLKGKKATHDQIETALNGKDKKAVLGHLAKDSSVESSSSKSAKRTLKAALGCANVDEDLNSC